MILWIIQYCILMQVEYVIFIFMKFFQRDFFKHMFKNVSIAHRVKCFCYFAKYWFRIQDSYLRVHSLPTCNPVWSYTWSRTRTRHLQTHTVYSYGLCTRMGIRKARYFLFYQWYILLKSKIILSQNQRVSTLSYTFSYIWK